MYVLGLNAYHADSSACLMKDGVLLAAAEEERFRREKHWAGFPTEAIRFCLADANISLSDVAHVAVNTDPKAALTKKIAYALKRLPSPRLIADRLRNQGKRLSMAATLQQHFPNDKFTGELHFIEHHLAHLASAFLVSPFEKAAVVSVDGFGDFSSTAWGVGSGRTIEIHNRVHFPHSLGIFYQSLTQYLGFYNYGDEYKVMGLAPYGTPSRMLEMQQIVRSKPTGEFELDLKYFLHHREKIDYAWSGGTPKVGRLYTSALEDLLGPARAPNAPLEDRHRDIARSAQAMYESVFFNLLRAVQRNTGLDTLALAGGCAMNSVANGKIMRETPFKRLYVQSAAGDAGGAIGAAAVVSVQSAAKNATAAPVALKGERVSRPWIMEHAYTGPAASGDKVAETIDAAKASDELTGSQISHIPSFDQLALRVATAIANGKVVGWYQGRMEWGPRALGNRSILADPRRADMKDILNLKIKRRESFRPFAPSILDHAVPEWFEESGDVPYMMQVYNLRSDKRKLIPAVTHVDGSGRLQTVNLATNPRYFELITAFYKLTGVPMVLNTSFNENEPVVCTAKEALGCYLRTNMDIVVLGDTLIERASS